MKKILVLVFCLAAVGSTFAAQNPCDVKIGSHKAVTPVDRSDKDWWMPRHQAVIERIKQGNVDLIMLGDSITHGWENAGKATWDKYYADRNAVNMGFSGDKTEHLLWRLQNGEIENINPKLAVIMIGTNNSAGDYTPEQILVLSIFPRGDAEQRKDKNRNASYNPQWKRNDDAVKIFKQIADNKMIYFLDINKKFLNKKGELPRDIMPDLLHPKEKGYDIWAKAMEPTIARLMNEKKKK